MLPYAQWTHKCVSVQEDTFAVLGQRPAVDLGEGDAELRTSQQGQVDTVLTVHHIHYDDLIKYILQGEPDEIWRFNLALALPST